MSDKTKVHHLVACDLVIGSGGHAAVPTARKPRQRRRPTLVSVAKQAEKAGLAVARYEVDPDGKIAIVTGKPEPIEQAASDLDRELAAWEARHAH